MKLQKEYIKPPFETSRTQLMYDEADVLVLEGRTSFGVSDEGTRSFKMFDDRTILPEIYEKAELQPKEDTEEKHSECDFDTSPADIMTMRERMIEHVENTIQFYVEC